MSDEMNTNNGEETAALFVSSQKKKQAEEEARKKAEAEQAKRDAAEAEVRRMEAEVEERKRKAEEERKALEEAARQAELEKANMAEKLKASVNVEEIKSKVKEKTEGKSKLPIFIGIGAAAVVIIALILVFALKGKGKAVDFETLAFDKEYTQQQENSTVSFFYPESMYTGFKEDEKEDNYIGLVAESDNAKNPELRVFMTKPCLQKDNPARILVKNTLNALKIGSENLLSNYKLKTVDEKMPDVSADESGKYYYRASATSDDGFTAAIASWLEPDNNGDYIIICAMFREKGDDPANVGKLRDMFEEKNSDNALMLPGSVPPQSDETDGMLEIDEMHMGIIVPKDRFQSIVKEDGRSWWVDDNGALYKLEYAEVNMTFDDAREHIDEVQPLIKGMSDDMSGFNELSEIESRMFLKDNWDKDLKYIAEYKDVMDGITYWEGNSSAMWHDVRTDKYYFYNVLLLAPQKNQEVYKSLFDKAMDRLQDI